MLIIDYPHFFDWVTFIIKSQDLHIDNQNLNPVEAECGVKRLKRTNSVSEYLTKFEDLTTTFG